MPFTWSVILQMCHHTCFLLLKFHSSTEKIKKKKTKNQTTAYVYVPKILDPQNLYTN